MLRFFLALRETEYGTMYGGYRPVPERPPVALQDSKGRSLEGIHFDLQRFEPNSSEWLGRWRYTDNKHNDYGIDGVHMQDQAITESMGPIVDRTLEHLGSSDQMIMRTRRALLKAVRSQSENGAALGIVDKPELYWGVRSGEMMIREGADWIDAYDELRKTAGPSP